MSDPEDNIAIIRRLIVAMEQADDVTLRELYTPDHVDHFHWHDPRPLPGSEDQPLLDRYEQSDANDRNDFPDRRFTIEEQFACGDRVVTVATSHATHARSGIPVTERAIIVNRIVDGKIAESWISADRLGMLQQLGVVDASQALFERVDLTQ
jgi:predicted ester cyclase